MSEDTKYSLNMKGTYDELVELSKKSIGPGKLVQSGVERSIEEFEYHADMALIQVGYTFHTSHMAIVRVY